MEIIFDNISAKSELKNLSLTIKDNEITVLSGDVTKELVANLIIGFQKVNNGEIKLLGEVINSETTSFANIQSQIGYVFLNPKDFLTNKTVKQEMLFGLKYYNFKDLNSRLFYYLNLVGLKEEDLNKKSLEISISDQKKLMLAAVLAIEPKIIILNYIDHGLNIKEQRMIKNILKNLKKDKIIIIVSNNSNFFLDIADRIIVFNNKKIVLEGYKNIFDKKSVNKYLDIPNISAFIKMANSKKLNLMATDDIKELMKDIYRKVHEK